MHFIGNLPNKRYRCYSHNRIPDKVRDPGRFSARSHRRIWHLHNWSRWLSRRSSCLRSLRSLRSWTDSRNLHVPVLSYCISMYLHHMIILCTILCTIIYVCVNVTRLYKRCITDPMDVVTYSGNLLGWRGANAIGNGKGSVEMSAGAPQGLGMLGKL